MKLAFIVRAIYHFIPQTSDSPMEQRKLEKNQITSSSPESSHIPSPEIAVDKSMR